ncbi:MAG: hypothetical protein MUE44_23955 [Oscillatoriaceae cyanobacterium Prado104]|jgi:hypothetical protein|nr:hypothetical protein [Oscillatoriaceae cyanobacterium Prado104]
MKLRSIALSIICSLPLFVPLSLAARADDRPCRADLDASKGTDDETNNCPITDGKFSIRGTFSNRNFLASFWAWEPAHYILYVENKKSGSKINLTGFHVAGTTNRPQYRFVDNEQKLTYVVSFRYSEANAIRLEIYQNNRAIVNELLIRESDKLIGGP